MTDLLEHQKYRTLRDALADLGRGARPLGTVVVHEENGDHSLDNAEVTALIDALNREIEP